MNGKKQTETLSNRNSGSGAPTRHTLSGRMLSRDNGYGPVHPFFSPLPVILAHRGDSEFFPENTLPSFTSAARLGVDVIETDIRLTADNRIVIWHDETLDRETNGRGPVERMTLGELRHIDAGYRFSSDGGETFPFRSTGIKLMELDEALEALPEMRFNIDLKTKSPELVRNFCRTVIHHHAEGRILGASFHTRNLRALRTALPDLATSYATAEVVPLLAAQRLGISPPLRLLSGQVLQVPEFFGRIRVLTPQFIHRFHQAGQLIQVWTVNESKEMLRFLEMGVDGIFTDNPRLLIEVLPERYRRLKS